MAGILIQPPCQEYVNSANGGLFAVTRWESNKSQGKQSLGNLGRVPLALPVHRWPDPCWIELFGLKHANKTSNHKVLRAETLAEPVAPHRIPAPQALQAGLGDLQLVKVLNGEPVVGSPRKHRLVHPETTNHAFWGVGKPWILTYRHGPIRSDDKRGLI